MKFGMGDVCPLSPIASPRFARFTGLFYVSHLLWSPDPVASCQGGSQVRLVRADGMLATGHAPSRSPLLRLLVFLLLTVIILLVVQFCPHDGDPRSSAPT